MGFINRIASSLGFERKNNPAFAQYMNYGGLPQPVMMQANPNAFMKEGYRRNDTVHKCVSYAARNAAGIRLALYTDKTRKREITTHALLDKLGAPNKDMSGNDYVESVCAYTLLIGNSYQYALRLAKNGPPDELWSLNPGKIDIVPGPNRILRYDFKIKEPPTPFEPSLIGHTKFWNPDDDLYGLSPIEVAGIFVDMNLAYRKWNLALTQNMAQPPGAWTTPALLGKKERDTLEANINQKYNGFKNAGKAPVLDGGLKFESYMVPPAQMAFLEGQEYNSSQIANIYNLAPQVIGDTSASTYDNFEQAVYGSYTECIFPLMDKVCGTWNRWLVPMYPDLKASGAYLGYDKQSVETIQKIMQAQEDAKAERWTKVWLAGGCKLNEYRDKIGLPAAKVGGDSYRIKDILIAEVDLEKYAEQCLTAPAAQTPPVPEGTPVPAPIKPKPGGKSIDDITQYSIQIKQGNNEPAFPKDTEAQNHHSALHSPQQYSTQATQKNLDQNGVYQPDDLQARLALYEAQGVIATTWTGGTCDVCMSNNGKTVPLGQPFPSGHILPKAHPNCECESIPIYEQKRIIPFHPRDDQYRALLRRRA